VANGGGVLTRHGTPIDWPKCSRRLCGSASENAMHADLMTAGNTSDRFVRHVATQASRHGIVQSQRLVEALRPRVTAVSAGTLVVHEGDKVPYLIALVDGWIALSKSLRNGDRQIIDFALPGEFIFAASADASMAALEVQALTDTLLARHSHTQWKQLIAQVPEMESVRTVLSGATRARIAERMLRLGKGTAQMRIAYALLELCIRLRALGEGTDQAFHIPLTQQQLGEFMGLSSVHVCRTMRRLERNGIIDVADHMDVRVRDAIQLAEIAKVDIDCLRAEILPRPLVS
jgi:CRP-like cAMP-binding protein